MNESDITDKITLRGKDKAFFGVALDRSLSFSGPSCGYIDFYRHQI
jgi:predicted nucleic-acid-binding Zn-ribbon protein